MRNLLGEVRQHYEKLMEIFYKEYFDGTVRMIF